MTSRVHIPRGGILSCLRPVLNKWIDLNVLLALRWQKYPDVPWWYNERASVGIFAGAVWHTGVYAFEEFASEKSGKSKFHAGREDLEFCVGSSEFKAEAKQCFFSGDNFEASRDRISASMESAIADIRKSRSYGMRKLAIVFGVPYLKKTSRSDMNAQIEHLANECSSISSDAVACVFPKLKERAIDEGKHYPGAIVWIKKVGR